MILLSKFRSTFSVDHNTVSFSEAFHRGEGTLLGGNVSVIVSKIPVFLVALVLGNVLLVGTPSTFASDASDRNNKDVPVLIDLMSLDKFSDASGQPISIDAETGGSGRRTLEGRASDGGPVAITIYSVAVHDEFSAEDLKAYAEATVDQPLETGEREELTERRGPAPELAASVVVAKTATTISVAWAAPAYTDSYLLTVGSESLASETPSFVLENRQPGETYQLTLGSRGNAPSDAGFTPVNTSKSISVTTFGNGNKDVSGRPGGSYFPGSAEISSTEFNYRTFLPYEFISDSPEPGDFLAQQACLALAFGPPSPFRPHTYSFGGDNRTFSAPSSAVDFRTMMSARYDFTTQTFLMDSDVGETVVWDMDDGVIVDSRRADKGGMEAINWIADADIGQVQFIHVANDPFCPSSGTIGAISYTVDVVVYDDGTVFVEGLQAAMPAHEGWVQSDDSGAWKSLFTNAATNLGCLVGFPVIAGCSIVIDAQGNSDPCVVNPQQVDYTLTDNWLISDWAMRQTVSWNLYNQQYAPLTIADARDYTWGYFNYYPTPKILDGIEQATNLEFLAVSESTGICSFEPIRNLIELKTLRISTGEVTNLDMLTNLNLLEDLAIYDSPQSVEPVSDMTALEYLRLDGSRLTNITGLSGLTGLKQLSLFGSAPTDWTPVETLTGLYSLDVRYSNITQSEVDSIQAAIGPSVTILTSL